MIKIKIISENNQIKTISSTGHANYADYGKDIVCASVSSIIITTVNGINSIDNSAINVDNSKDNVTIIINKNTELVSKLIFNMIDLLNELQKQYPKNINIKEETI